MYLMLSDLTDNADLRHDKIGWIGIVMMGETTSISCDFENSDSPDASCCGLFNQNILRTTSLLSDICLFILFPVFFSHIC